MDANLAALDDCRSFLHLGSGQTTANPASTASVAADMSDFGAGTSLGEDDSSSSVNCASSIAENVNATPYADRLLGAYQRVVVGVESQGPVYNKPTEWEQQLDSADHGQVASNQLSMPHTQWGFVQDQLGAFARELARLRQEMQKNDERQTDATRQVSVTQAEIAKESMTVLDQLTTEQKRFKEAVERERSARQACMEQLGAQIQEAHGAIRTDLKTESLTRKEACMNISGDLALAQQAVEREISNRVNAVDKAIGEFAELHHVHKQETQEEARNICGNLALVQQAVEREISDRVNAVDKVIGELAELHQLQKQETQERSAAFTRWQQAVEQDMQSRNTAVSKVASDMAALKQASEQEVQDLRQQVSVLQGQLQQEVNDRCVADSDTAKSMQWRFEQEAQLRQAVCDKSQEHGEAIQQWVADIESLRKALEQEVQDRQEKEQQNSLNLQQTWNQERGATEKGHHALQSSLEDLDVKLRKEFARELSAAKLSQHMEMEKFREQVAKHGTTLLEYKAQVREDRSIYTIDRTELEQKLRDDLNKIAVQVAKWSDVETRLRDDFKQIAMSKEAVSQLEERVYNDVKRVQRMNDEKLEERLGEMSQAMKSHTDDVHKMRDLINEKLSHMDALALQLDDLQSEGSSMTTICGARTLQPRSMVTAGEAHPHAHDRSAEQAAGPRVHVRSGSSALAPGSAQRVVEALAEMPQDARPRSMSRGRSATTDVVRQASAPQPRPRINSASLVAPATPLRRPAWHPGGAEQQRAVPGAGISGAVPNSSVALASSALLSPGAPSAAVQHLPPAGIQRSASSAQRHASPLRRVPAQGVTGHPSIAARPVVAAPV